MIGIVDYGAGNLRSVSNALAHLDLTYQICRRARDLDAVDRVIVPGVGHFGAAVDCMRRTGLFDGLTEFISDHRPLLGICLGMQLLFDGSHEAPSVRGLGILGGQVERLCGPRVPHMGWNTVELRSATAGPTGVGRGPYYFAHSYAAVAESDVIVGVASTGGEVCAAVVGRDLVWGVQFHPEKSGAAGLGLLEEFARW